MASESTVVSDHSTAPEQVEKVNEEVKKIEQEGSPPSSGSGEEEKLKAEVLPSQPAPSPELEEKIEEKQIEPSLAEEVKTTDEKPISDVSVEDKPIVDSTKSQPVDQPEIESVEKQPKEQPATEKQPEEAPKMGDVTEPSVVADSAKSQPEEQLPTESVEKLPLEQPPVEVAEKQPEEQPKISDTPEPSVDAVEKTDQVEVLPVKESETVVGKDAENSQAEAKKEETPEPVHKPEEQSDAAEQVEPKESVKVEIAKDEGTLADKSEVPQLKEEPAVTESSDQITPTTVEAEVDMKEDGGENPPTVVTEDANVDDKEKELSGSNVVEVLSKEEVGESGKVELESEGKNVKTEEENQEKEVITEESDEPKTDKVEDASSSISPREVTEKSLEVDNTFRDMELAAENGKESIKDETVTSVETEKNGELEGKVDEVTTTTVTNPVEEPQKSEKEAGETEQTGETILEKEKEAGEIAKPDVPPPESLAKDGDETKTSQEPPKEEPSTKPTKQSNNLISKVKQSLVKAKKAVIGKSPNSKSLSFETKGDVKDK